nr:Chain B, Trinucleotide repeat-containing gene 6C protein [Homo sapiens]7RUQ_D Chain D, Trinucleotide repeat-containing gene 6C protein [Homo sapiens]
GPLGSAPTRPPPGLTN